MEPPSPPFLGRPEAAAAAAHRFGPQLAQLYWGTDDERRLAPTTTEVLTIMHISDAHVSLTDDAPPRTTRMFNAFKQTTDKVSRERTSSGAEFVRLLQLACAKRVDVIALGGDIVNFPSDGTVAWVLERLRDEGCGIPFVYTSGNHDWHEEGLGTDVRYDSQRLLQLGTTLKPFYEGSLSKGQLYGSVVLKGVELMVIDNSNYQITEEQLQFARERLHRKAGPVILLLHIPLALPGLSLPPKACCGHSAWGAMTDDLYRVEGRPRWPAEGNAPETLAFLELVRASAAPAGRIAALLTGHVHRDFSVDLVDSQSAANHTALACSASQPGCLLRPAASVFQVGAALAGQEALMEAHGAVQYTTLDAAEGGYRLLEVHVRRGA